MTPTEDDSSLLLRDIQDSLDDIKYTGHLENLESVVEAGVKSLEFLSLVRFLVKEVSTIYDLQGHDDLQEADLDSEAGMMELSSFLRDLECPHSILIEGPVTQRLADKKAKLILLDFLLAETMTARITAVNKPDTNNLSIRMSESPEAASLKKMLLALGFPKPPENITPLQLWEKVTAKVQEQMSKGAPDLLGKPLMSKQVLTEDQWEQIQTIAEGLNADYSLRRKMLLTRMDATIQSFTWSDRIKGREGEVGDMYRARRQLMSEAPGVMVSDLLAAREDEAIMEAVSGSGARQHTRTSINKVLIGAVPDRGGRTETMAAPPPEMPSWQQRLPDQGRGGRGGGRGHNKGGGGQGGYQGAQGGQGGYQGGHGGYQGAQGGYQGGQGGYQGGHGSYQGAQGGYQGVQGGYQGGQGVYQGGQGGEYNQGDGGYQQGGGGHKGGRGSGRVQGAGWGAGGGGGGSSRGRGGRKY